MNSDISGRTVQGYEYSRTSSGCLARRYRLANSFRSAAIHAHPRLSHLARSATASATVIVPFSLASNTAEGSSQSMADASVSSAPWAAMTARSASSEKVPN